MNLAFREFIGYDLHEEIPDHSTLSKNRHGRFKGPPVFQEIFDEIVRQCIAKGLVAGKHLSFDGTVIQADASYESMVPRRVVEMSPAEYIQKVEQENPVTAESGEHAAAGAVPAPPGSDADAGSSAPGTGTSPDGDSAPPVTNNGGNEEPHRKRRKATPKTNATHVSRTDPDARIYGRPGQPKKLGYIDCITVDSLRNIITGVEVIPGDGDEARVLVPMVSAQMFKFGFRPESVSGDKGHGEARVYKELYALGIEPFIPHQNFHEINPKIWPQERFQYDPASDCYICPAGKTLRYQGDVDRGIMKVYRARPQDCGACPYKTQCTAAKRIGRTIKRHVDAHLYERVDHLLKRPGARERAIWRRTGPETLFGEAKEEHGLRWAKFRGREHVKEQCLMTAVAQNIKRMVKVVGTKAPPKAAAVAVRVQKVTQIQDVRRTRPYFSSRTNHCPFGPSAILAAVGPK